jgi:hypothetical protein
LKGNLGGNTKWSFQGQWLLAKTVIGCDRRLLNLWLLLKILLLHLWLLLKVRRLNLWLLLKARRLKIRLLNLWLLLKVRLLNLWVLLKARLLNLWLLLKVWLLKIWLRLLILLMNRECSWYSNRHGNYRLRLVGSMLGASFIVLHLDFLITRTIRGDPNKEPTSRNPQLPFAAPIAIALLVSRKRYYTRALNCKL